VQSIERSLALWRDTLGVEPEIREFPEHKMREAAFFLGEVQIQLYQSTEPGLRFSKWIDEHGGDGLHHVCFQVSDLAAAVGACRAAGLEIVEPAPVSGSQGIHQRLTDASGQGLEIEFLEVHPHLKAAMAAGIPMPGVPTRRVAAPPAAPARRVATAKATRKTRRSPARTARKAAPRRAGAPRGRGRTRGTNPRGKKTRGKK
jgi:methylmalonyl-CoA/ethylmalonyl-CoA epimerase